MRLMDFNWAFTTRPDSPPLAPPPFMRAKPPLRQSDTDSVDIRFGSTERPPSEGKTEPEFHSQLIQPTDGLVCQQYNKAHFTDPKTQQTVRIERQGSRFTVFNCDNQPIAEKDIPPEQWPKNIIIDNANVDTDIDGDGLPCVSHMDLVLAYERRHQPFSTYELFDQQPNMIFDSGTIANPLPLFKHLLKRIQQGEVIDTINLSFGSEVPLCTLSTLLDTPFTQQSLPQHQHRLLELITRIGQIPEEQLEQDGYIQQLKQDYIKAFPKYLPADLHPAPADDIDPTEQLRDMAEFSFDKLVGQFRITSEEIPVLEAIGQHGTRIFKASGNSGPEGFDLTLLAKGITGVGATTAANELAEFSSLHGPNGVLEQGVFHLAADPQGDGFNITQNSNGVDLPTAKLSGSRTHQFWKFAGKPLDGVLMPQKSIDRLHQLAADIAKNPPQYPLLQLIQKAGREGIKMSEHLIPIDDYLKLRAAFGDTAWTFVKDLGDYVCGSGAPYPFDVSTKGIVVVPSRKIPKSIEGTSFATPTASGKYSLGKFMAQHFPHVLTTSAHNGTH